MSKTTFKTNPRSLEELLKDCGSGKIQLPDFQRSWVWAEDRILSLIASVSHAFPVGALMTLESKRESDYAHRPIEGAPPSATNAPADELLLDGQQRMTSLYQACWRREVVKTITPKNKVVWRWFYIDIAKALQTDGDREDAIFAMPEDRRLKAPFGRDIILDLDSQEKEFERMMFPLNRVFDWDEWQEGFGDYWINRHETHRRDTFKAFKNEVLSNFKSYQVPVITLGEGTSHAAVCLVFEKVNTGGKPLDAFELLTAMYAARGHKLRDDWLGADGKPGLKARLAEYGRTGGQPEGVLAKVASTDFLQAIALRHTKQVRAEQSAAGVKDNDLPAVRATRQSLLDLPLEAYLKYRESVEAGFKHAARILHDQYIYRALDLPYQTQLVPLAAILSEIGANADHAGNRAKLIRWYWCGVFGELYGSAVESRFGKDIVEVPAWLVGGPDPTTVREGVFRAGRLSDMRTRLSAAYKGIHALLMREGARDFRTGQRFDTTVFFDEGVDIHHIFPEAWCATQGIDRKTYDTVINKTPLSFKTNRIIGGIAPSKYLAKLEDGKLGKNGQIEEPPLGASTLDTHLASHCVPVDLLRRDDFTGFMAARRAELLRLISAASGHQVADLADPGEGEDPDEQLARDSDLMGAAQ